MDVDTFRPVDDIVPITRASDAREVGLAAYDQQVALLRSLPPDDWHAPTECPAWDVADMVGHVIGAAKAGASLRENVRQQLWGARHAAEHGNNLDATNHRQILDHARLTPAQRVAELERVAAAALTGRLRVPPPLRALPIPIDAGGSTAAGMPSTLRVGHLMDVVYSRDVWLHTIDIARATGRSPGTDPQLDRRIVEDVVAEWAARHGRPVQLELTGPAGGRFRQGQGGEHLRLDAIAFCRVLSGRAEPDDVAAGGSASAATRALLTTRVFF